MDDAHGSREFLAFCSRSGASHVALIAAGPDVICRSGPYHSLALDHARPSGSLRSGAIAVMQKHVFIDTQLIHPALIRASVDLLGAGNVIAGSDWPIVDDGPIRNMLTQIECGTRDFRMTSRKRLPRVTVCIC